MNNCSTPSHSQWTHDGVAGEFHVFVLLQGMSFIRFNLFDERVFIPYMTNDFPNQSQRKNRKHSDRSIKNVVFIKVTRIIQLGSRVEIRRIHLLSVIRISDKLPRIVEIPFFFWFEKSQRLLNFYHICCFVLMTCFLD